MAKNEKRISSVKLHDYGLKGMEIKHAVVRRDKNGREWIDEDTKRSKMPIDKLTKDLFKQGAKFFYDIIGLRKDFNGRITGIISNGKFVQLTGVIECVHGRDIGVSTAIITENDGAAYDNYYELLNWVDQVYEQVVVYMSGKTGLDNKQYVLDLAETDAGKKALEKQAVDLSTLNKMSEKEAMVLATKFLEEKGAIVMMDEPDGEDENNEEVFAFVEEK